MSTVHSPGAEMRKPRPPGVRRHSICLPRIALIVLVLAACARPPSGPFYQQAAAPEGRRSLVYVYRIDKVNSVGAIKIRVDGGGPTIEIRNGEYLPLYLRAGGRRLELKLPLFGGLDRGWNSVPVRAEPGGTHFVRIWAGIDEIDRGLMGRPDDFGAPGRADRYANVNVFGGVWSTRESERDIRTLQLAPGAPTGAR